MCHHGTWVEQPGWRTLLPLVTLALMIPFVSAQTSCEQDATEPPEERTDVTAEQLQHEPPPEQSPDPSQPPPDPTPEQQALHVAVANGETDEIRRLVIDEGVDIHSWNWDQVTPLHTAARIGRVDSLQTLIDLGADVNARGRLNITPLLWAVRTNQAEVVRVLLENGADPNIRGGRDGGLSPLGLAQRRGRQEIAALLIEHDAVP